MMMAKHDDNGVAVASEEGVLSVSAMTLRAALQRGSMPDAMALFKTLQAPALRQTLLDVGFAVDPWLVSQGRNAVFSSAKNDLGEALALRTDGFGLQSVRARAGQAIESARSAPLSLEPIKTADLVSGPSSLSFAAKEKGEVTKVTLAFDASEFDGDVEAARVIQKVMRSSAIDVGLLGEALPRERQALLMVAGQGLAKGIQGFGFDGIAGKYKVPLSLAEVHGLHQNAAQSVAEESVRSSLKGWAAGRQPTALHEYVLDSVQRLLQGSVSVEAAGAILDAMKSGGLARHAGEIGGHQSSALFMRQGLDVNALSVLEQVKPLGMTVVEPDRKRGQYFGSVVGLDHRAAMLKVSRTDLLELALVALPAELEKPRMGDTIRLGFKNGEQSINIMSRHGVGNGVGR